MMTELPEGIRVPLHEMSADLAYAFGRVRADGSCAPMFVKEYLTKFDALEAAIRRLIARADDANEALAECLEYFENRQDADFDSETGFIPNKEMVLASRIKTALGEA